MIFKVLEDNTAKCDFVAEWGLSIYIEYAGHKILLDAGKSSNFAENARMMGVDLSDVELAVLSHGHYDHADGFPTFFSINKTAQLYVSESLKENCYKRENRLFMKYIGIKRGFIKAYNSRLVRVSGEVQPINGMHILTHSLPSVKQMGKSSKMYKRDLFWFRPEDFSHELTVVFEVGDGLAVFSSCSHGGVDNIMNEVKTALPGKKIVAYVGGLHLHNSTKEQVLDVCEKLKVSGLKTLYTGHCTGENAISMIKSDNDIDIRETFAGMSVNLEQL